MYRILVVDDDKDILRALSIYLFAEGYEPLAAASGNEALALVEKNDVQLAVVDVMMPGMDGLTLTSKLRETHNFPIILLTAKSEDGDKVLGLTVGADDYVTKPFVPVELLARVKSQLRRYTRLGGMPVRANLLRVGGVELDDEQKKVSLDGEPVSLTPIEYAILRLFMQNPNKVFSSRTIYETVWSGASVGSENLVAVHVRHIREKLEFNPADPRYIKVVWGQGYKIESNQS